MSQKKQRIVYIMAFLLFLGIEVLIGIYVHDQVIRPYIGDMLVVIVLYCFIRIFIPKRYPFMPLSIFIFAALVEYSQALHLTERISLLNNTICRIVLGATFDIKDIACYAVGCLILGIFEYIIRRK